MEKNVYNKIAKKYNKNEKTLKSEIYKATDKMNEVKVLKNLNKKVREYDVKKTPKMIINDIVEKIKH